MEIALLYLKELVSEETLASIASELKPHGIDFQYLPAPDGPKASIHELYAPLMLMISTDPAQAYLISLAASASYDAIKSATFRLLRQIQGKTLTRLQAGGKKSLMPASMDLTISLDKRTSLRLKFKGDIPPGLQEKCVDNAFQLIRDTDMTKLTGSQIAVFDQGSLQWKSFSEKEFIELNIKNCG